VDDGEVVALLAGVDEHRARALRQHVPHVVLGALAGLQAGPRETTGEFNQASLRFVKVVDPQLLQLQSVSAFKRCIGSSAGISRTREYDRGLQSGVSARVSDGRDGVRGS